MSERVSPRGVRETQRTQLQFEARAGAGGDGGHRLYGVTAINAGEANGLTYSAEVLRRAAPLFEGASCMVDHGGLDSALRGGRSVREVLGVLRGVAFDEGGQAVTGTLDVYPGADQEWFCALADAYIADRAAGRTAPSVGLSAVLDVRVNGELAVTEIERVYSVDAVFDPARGGEIVRALNQRDPLTGALPRQDDVETRQTGGVEVLDEVNVSAEAEPAAPAAAAVSSRVRVERPADGVVAPAPAAAPGEQDETVPREQHETGPAAPVQDAGVLVALSDSVLEMRLQRTQLPDELQAMVRAEFGGRLGNVGQMDARIEQLQSAWGKAVAQAGVVHGVGAVRPSGLHAVRADGAGAPARYGVGLNEADKLQAVMDRMCGVQLASEALRSLPPVSGIRELYLMLTGDYELRGQFDSERVQLANVTTSTLSSLVKNAFNKVILDYFNVADRWWEPIVSQEDYASTQDLTLITLGGFGDLPAVSEGAAYTELEWSDTEEVVSFAKKGGYVGVTLEMMDKDETRAFRAIPRKLAIAGYRTLSAAISALWTANAGVGAYWPSDQSTYRLFNNTYGNLGTTALSAAAWDAVIQAMYKMTEATSGERMGIRPAFCVVPIELEKTALTIFESAGEPGTGDNDANVRRGSSRVVVCPEMTDNNNWLAVADPRVWPGLMVGFRFGRVPEVFVADSELTGSMFTNDEMRIKARYWFAVGVGDYRPLYKSNVT